MPIRKGEDENRSRGKRDQKELTAATLSGLSLTFGLFCASSDKYERERSVIITTSCENLTKEGGKDERTSINDGLIKASIKSVKSTISEFSNALTRATYIAKPFVKSSSLNRQTLDQNSREYSAVQTLWPDSALTL